ncbi:MAG: hypothetical protein ACJAVW_003657, partial [Spirosomataceae bacterium]
MGKYISKAATCPGALFAHTKCINEKPFAAFQSNSS